jgi:hypothetical protein
VRIYVPVVHALDEIDTTGIVFKDTVKEIPFSPIVSCDLGP